MPFKNIKNIEANILVKPNPFAPEEWPYPAPFNQVCIGDLHANCLGLLYYCLKVGLVDISESDYEYLSQIYYKKVDDLTENDLAQFDRILNNITIVNEKILLRLIGDELSDRGMNDYFILKFLLRLKKLKINYEILLSNHGIEFVIAYENYLLKNNKEFYPCYIRGIQRSSTTNLSILVKRGLVKIEEVSQIVEECYKPHLKLLSYSLEQNEKSITIFSHAAIDVDIILILANRLNVLFDSSSPIKLAETIERINQVFSSILYQNGMISLYVLKKEGLSFANQVSKSFTRVDNVIYFIVWNRNYNELERKKLYSGHPDFPHLSYTIFYGHGHDMSDPDHNDDHVFA